MKQQHPVITNVFQDLAETIVSEQKEYLHAKKGLLQENGAALHSKAESIGATLQGEYTQAIETFVKASEILQKAFHNLPQIEQEEIAKEILQEKEKWENKLSSLETTFSFDLDKETLLSDKTATWIYQVGKNLLDESKDEEALSIFYLLVFVRPSTPDAWQALGYVQEKLKMFEKALYSFSVSSLLNPENALCRTHTAALYLQLGAFEDALAELEALSEIIEKQNLPSFKEPMDFLVQKAKNKDSNIGDINE